MCSDDTPDPVPPPVPSSDERVRLVRAYQTEAASRPDLLSAILGMLTGDHVLITSGLRKKVQQLLDEDASAGKNGQLTPSCQLYLKAMQQTERLAQFERRSGPRTSQASQPHTDDDSE